MDVDAELNDQDLNDVDLWFSWILSWIRASTKTHPSTD